MGDRTGKEQEQGDLAQEILNRIVTDADFRQHLLDNPAETLANAGYTGGDDVSGYGMHVDSLLRNPLPLGRGGHVAGGGGDPPTTAINCGPPPPATTAINCGVNPPSSTIKPKLTNS
jgi:hypothetical protein